MHNQPPPPNSPAEPDYDDYLRAQEQSHWANLDEQEAEVELQDYFNEHGDYPPGHPFHLGFVPTFEEADPDAEVNDLYWAARALYAARHNCNTVEIDAALEADPAVYSEIESLMDEIAIPGLCDDLANADTDGLVEATYRKRALVIALHNEAIQRLVPGDHYMTAYKIAREYVANRWQEEALYQAVLARYHDAKANNAHRIYEHLWHVLRSVKYNSRRQSYAATRSPRRTAQV